MIPISSQSPTLPSHNSLNYELLSLTAICGEVPCTCSARLTASESYRKKVVTSLTHDKLLRIFSRHHLRGYRLGVRGKRLLLQQEPERFAFYLSGCSDTNAIKSEISRRIRLHRIAQTYVTMLNAGAALIYRDEKLPIFSPAASGPFCIEQPCFYDSHEIKESELEMLKIRGSRMAGALFTSGRVFAVYNSMEFLPVFDPQVEMRAKVMLEQVCRTKVSFSLRASGLLLSNNIKRNKILIQSYLIPTPCGNRFRKTLNWTYSAAICPKPPRCLRKSANLSWRRFKIRTRHSGLESIFFPQTLCAAA